MSTARMALPTAEPAADIFDQLRHASGLLTAHELSQILRLSPKTLYSYAERDLIPHFKIETTFGSPGWKWRNGCADGTPNTSNSPGYPSARMDNTWPDRLSRIQLMQSSTPARRKRTCRPRGSAGYAAESMLRKPQAVQGR